jgi:hypothetical protein
MFLITKQFKDGVLTFFLEGGHDPINKGITFVPQKIRMYTIQVAFINIKKPMTLSMFV